MLLSDWLKKELLILFLEKLIYQAYEDKFYIAGNVYFVLTMVNSASQYAFLCCEV